MATRTVACSLRISAGGAAPAGVHGESGYWGPCGFRPLFFLHEESSFYFSSGSDGVTAPLHPAGPSRRATGGGRPPGGACAGPGAHCGVGPAWVARGLFPAEQPSNPATGAKSEVAQTTSVFL